MRKSNVKLGSVMVAVLLVALMLAACAPATPNESPIVDEEAADSNTSPDISPDTSAQTGDAQLAAWQTAQVRDVNSGETFSLADFAGKTVFVHPMAVWCLNCRISQRSLRDFVMTEFSEDEVVFVSFTVEPQTPEADLRAYTDEQGFDWRYFVSSPDMMRQLVDEFGFAIGTPPVQPHFIIRPDGTVTDLLVGNPPPDQTIQLIRDVIAGQA